MHCSGTVNVILDCFGLLRRFHCCAGSIEEDKEKYQVVVSTRLEKHQVTIPVVHSNEIHQSPREGTECIALELSMSFWIALPVLLLCRINRGRGSDSIKSLQPSKHRSHC